MRSSMAQRFLVFVLLLRCESPDGYKKKKQKTNTPLLTVLSFFLVGDHNIVTGRWSFIVATKIELLL